MGYIDKFYSTEIFHFDNRTAILSIIQNVFASIHLGVPEQEERFVRHKLFGDKLFYEVVSLLLEKGFLSLRSILKMWQKPFDAYYKEVTFSQKIIPIKGFSIPVVMQLTLLVDTIGDWVQLEKAFGSFEKNGFRIEGYDTAFNFLMAFLSYPIKDYFHNKVKSPYFISWRGLRLAMVFTTNQAEFGKLSVFDTIDGEEGEDPHILDDAPLVK